MADALRQHVGIETEAIIRIEGLEKAFAVQRTGQTVQALTRIDLNIIRGEFLTIVGPSGCGKSTILNIVAGLESPTRGQVVMNGQRIEGPSAERGMVFQDYALFPWMTVRQNIGFGLRYGPAAKRLDIGNRKALVDKYIDLVGLRGFEDRYPHELSGGMRQRCAVARLFANEPQVLLMDEPLAAVDSQTRVILQEELLHIWGQAGSTDSRKTVIFVTHAIDEAVFLSDRVAIMSRHPGRIKEVKAIDLPRPRQGATRSDPRFHRLTDEIWTSIREEAYRAALE